MPRLTYQTAAVSLAQFIVINILGVPNTIINIISTCHNDNSNCVSNMIVSLVFYIMTAVWFLIVVLVAYASQKKRSRQFAVILGGLEFITLIVSGYIDFPHDSNVLSKLTSLIDALLSVWIIYLALRLFISGNRRMVKKPNVVARARKARSR
ncbi:MAG TPA: hypothetical protein VGF75_00830 [Candidatus Saccharimonadales bacterium]|jgi:cadmium resistance protein CadD (predicted permease)